TRAFNQHFDTNAHAATKRNAQRTINVQKAAIAKDYQELIKEPLAAEIAPKDAQNRCHAALSGMAVIATHCEGKVFEDVDIDACVAAIKDAEGGPKRDRLATVIREQARPATAKKPTPADADLPLLAHLARERDEALRSTSGDVLRRLYRLTEQVMTDAAWPSPSLCPTCEKGDDQSVLDSVRVKLGQYEAVETATRAVGA